MIWKPVVPDSGRFPFMVIALFVFMGISCAKQGYPPGGLVDKTAPELVNSIPASDAVNVPATEPLVFEFSEPMDEESVEENLFIVPIPELFPEFEWHSRSKVLVLKHTQPLKDNTTYVVTIGAKACDIRRNGLEDSIVLCFSTGDVLENKKIKGKAIPYNFFSEKSEKISEIDIVAYRLSNNSGDPDPRNDVPDYFTQTGTDGSYEIAGLSGGLYRVFAIGDNDKDGFFTENYDLIGVMPHDIMLSESDSVLFAPEVLISSRYTTEVQLNSIRASDCQRIELFFNKDIEPESININIENLDIIGWFLDRKNPRVLSVATDVHENRRRYIIKNINVTDRDGNSLMTFESQPFFTGTDRPDTTAFEIEEWNPKILSSSDERINLVFNRILDVPHGTIGIIEQDSGEKLTVSRISPNELELAPVVGWQSGSNYVILLDREQLKSVSSNTLTEAGAKLAFRVVPPDTLGTIEGTIEDHTENPVSFYRLIIKHIDTNTVKEFNFNGTGKWSSGAVLPGRYLCLAHKDDNKDGDIFRGSMYPYSSAEQVTAYPDTVNVEPRWPVEGVNFIFN